MIQRLNKVAISFYQHSHLTFMANTILIEHEPIMFFNKCAQRPINMYGSENIEIFIYIPLSANGDLATLRNCKTRHAHLLLFCRERAMLIMKTSIIAAITRQFYSLLTFNFAAKVSVLWSNCIGGGGGGGQLNPSESYRTPCSVRTLLSSTAGLKGWWFVVFEIKEGEKFILNKFSGASAAAQYQKAARAKSQMHTYTHAHSALASSKVGVVVV